ncbi:MAG: hypothetical protein AAF581_03085 [Planctomycetota bacterium]
MNRLITALVFGLLATTQVAGQNPNYALSCDTVVANATGDVLAVDVTLSGIAAVDAWSFAICYDAAVAAPQGLVQGSAVPGLPDFYVAEISSGFVQQFVVMSFFAAVTLPPASNAPVLTMNFEAIGQFGEFTDLTFCNAGTPPTDNVLVVGATQVDPVLSDGMFVIGAVVPMGTFRRGDCDNSGTFNLPDMIYLLGHLFPPTGVPNAIDCFDACDTNDSGSLNLPDVIAGLTALFGQPTVPLPAPYTVCGADPVADTLSCDLFGGCP